jgi:hypothetical protein
VKHRFALGVIIQTYPALPTGIVSPKPRGSGWRSSRSCRAQPAPAPAPSDLRSTPSPARPPPSDAAIHFAKPLPSSSVRQPRGQSGVKPHALHSGCAARCWKLRDREEAGVLAESGEPETCNPCRVLLYMNEERRTKNPPPPGRPHHTTRQPSYLPNPASPPTSPEPPNHATASWSARGLTPPCYRNTASNHPRPLAERR